MKPNLVNAIITWKKINNVEYWQLTEAGENLRSDVLCWVFIHCLNNEKNLSFTLKGGKYFIGSKEFQEIMSNENAIK